MTLLSNALNAAEVTVYVNQMIRGAIIVAFIAFDHLTARGN
jgi:ribose/xylose/arabinose/galactoside ABC-type transport system permease subunit